MKLERIEAGSQLIALILKGSAVERGTHFVTPPELSQQVARMRHPAGKVIRAHTHRLVRREVVRTQEVLVIQRGRLRVDLYDDAGAFLESRVLSGGDIVLLVGGGHGFEMLEEVEMVEIKQGPHSGDHDKIFLDPAAARPGTITRSISG